MIIVGLLLLAAAAVAAVELVIANDQARISVHMWRWSWTVEPFWLAVAGAAVLVAALLGLYVLNAGSRRGRRLRRERRDLAKENRQLAERAEIADATASEPVADATPHDYLAPSETTSTSRREYATPAEQAYAADPAEGRHVNS